jgi:hypothetical protein
MAERVSIVSTSFLDLLSCALGAVIFLDLVFSLSLKPGFTDEDAMFVTINVELPLTGMSDRDADKTIDEFQVEIRDGDGNIIGQSSRDGFQEAANGNGSISWKRTLLPRGAESDSSPTLVFFAMWTRHHMDTKAAIHLLGKGNLQYVATCDVHMPSDRKIGITLVSNGASVDFDTGEQVASRQTAKPM